MIAELKTKDWHASQDFMPGGPPTLNVTGTVVCPTTGYKAKLVRHSPQGINPTIYILDLIVTPPAPGTAVDNVLTDLHVQYHEDTRTKYSQVTILPENITVDVKITS